MAKCFIVGLILLAALGVGGAGAAQSVGYSADLETYRTLAADRYAYLTPEKLDRLDAVLAKANPRNKDNLIRTLERTAHALDDHHAILGVN